MDKPADTDRPIHPLIRGRWSPRAFSDRLIEPSTLATILEAARWAPSAYNDQPWHYLVALRQDPGEHARLLGCLVEGNRAWAAGAAALLLGVARTRFAHDGSANRFHMHDAGQAAALLVIQAEALGIRAHQMGGYSARKAREAYGIPEGFEPASAFALGYPADPAALADRVRERELEPRDRRPLSEIAFRGGWGIGAALETKS